MSWKTSYFEQRAGRPFALLVFLSAIASQSACIVPPEDAARERAHYELQCDGPIYVEQRLSVHTYEATGCGRRVRYVCNYERGSVVPSCIPEPVANIQVVNP